ncbi:MAG: hypothetical protein Q8N63_08760 [Nanoarchaeota archaeon]|nr:hypothetical protein [Nanoarchaeota archaeon]
MGKTFFQLFTGNGGGKIFLLIIIIIVFLNGIFIKTGNVIKETDEVLKLNVNIHNKFEQILPGKEILAEIKLQFFEIPSELKDVYVTYEVKDLEGRIITKKSETFAIQTKASSIIEIFIPSDTEVGDYLLYVKTNYNGVEAEATDSFEVVENQFEQTMSTSNKLILIIFLLIILILSFYSAYKIKNRK